MKTFEQFMDDKGYDYGSFDICHQMDTIINEYGEYCATLAQQNLSGSDDKSSSPKCSHCNDDPGWKSNCVNPNCKNYAT